MTIKEHNIKTQDTYYENLKIDREEYSRLWCGELTEYDFSTSSPNPYRVSKIAKGVNDYLKYKRNHNV